jgi:AraC-like DNA-binding protein
MPPVDFIREIRVKRAAQLIRSDVYNFSQIAYMTGFSDPKYFSRCFKKHMGVTPSEYKNSINNEENNPDQ